MYCNSNLQPICQLRWMSYITRTPSKDNLRVMISIHQQLTSWINIQIAALLSYSYWRPYSLGIGFCNSYIAARWIKCKGFWDARGSERCFINVSLPLNFKHHVALTISVPLPCVNTFTENLPNLEGSVSMHLLKSFIFQMAIIKTAVFFSFTR